jgi:uncharacterized protein DUF2867
MDGVVDWEAQPPTSFRARRAPADAFRRLPLVVHSILSDVPLRDVTYVDLPRGGMGRTVADVRTLISGSPGETGNLPTRVLFAVRSWLGRVFGWDRARGSGESYRERIDPSVLARSRAPARTGSGPLDTLYELDDESLAEARNATVHAFMSTALLPRGDGYRLYWAIYVKPVSALTPLYMAVIEPFRRFIVYPSILRRIRDAWELRCLT